MDEKKAGLPEENLEQVAGGWATPYSCKFRYVCSECGHEEDVPGVFGVEPSSYDQRCAQSRHKTCKDGKTGKMEYKETIY